MTAQTPWDTDELMAHQTVSESSKPLPSFHKSEAWKSLMQTVGDACKSTAGPVM